MFSLSKFHDLPALGEPFVYDFDKVKWLIYSILRAKLGQTYPTKIRIVVGCWQIWFDQNYIFVKLAGHDAWMKLMRRTHLVPYINSRIILEVTWSKKMDIPSDQIAIEVILSYEPVAPESEELNPGGTLTFLRDKSLADFGYNPERIPYVKKCTKYTFDLWLEPLERRMIVKKGSAASLRLSIQGGTAERWMETGDKTCRVPSSSSGIIIGGSNAVEGGGVLRLDTDTVSDRHLQVQKVRSLWGIWRKREAHWKIRTLDGTAYIDIDDRFIGPGSDWVRLDGPTLVTLNDTTIRIEENNEDR